MTSADEDEHLVVKRFHKAPEASVQSQTPKKRNPIPNLTTSLVEKTPSPSKRYKKVKRSPNERTLQPNATKKQNKRKPSKRSEMLNHTLLDVQAREDKDGNSVSGSSNSSDDAHLSDLSCVSQGCDHPDADRNVYLNSLSSQGGFPTPMHRRRHSDDGKIPLADEMLNRIRREKKAKKEARSKSAAASMAARVSGSNVVSELPESAAPKVAAQVASSHIIPETPLASSRLPDVIEISSDNDAAAAPAPIRSSAINKDRIRIAEITSFFGPVQRTALILLPTTLPSSLQNNEVQFHARVKDVRSPKPDKGQVLSTLCSATTSPSRGAASEVVKSPLKSVDTIDLFRGSSNTFEPSIIKEKKYLSNRMKKKEVCDVREAAVQTSLCRADTECLCRAEIAVQTSPCRAPDTHYEPLTVEDLRKEIGALLEGLGFGSGV